MGWFTPYKKHANRFNYIPRYFDPEKEAREQRRAELWGERLDQAHEEYVPGKYIRTQREARNAKRVQEQGSGRSKVFRMVLVLMLMLFLLGVLVPGMTQLFFKGRRTPTTVESYYGDFDPSAPITIVPNDYEPSLSDE